MNINVMNIEKKKKREKEIFEWKFYSNIHLFDLPFFRFIGILSNVSVQMYSNIQETFLFYTRKFLT